MRGPRGGSPTRSGSRAGEAGLIRAVLKRSVERVLASPVVTSASQARLRGRRLILAYHGIIPGTHVAEPGGERALFIPQSLFAAQMDLLASVADVVGLHELDGAGDGRPRVAITFDDAYQGAVTCAVDELVARRLPATIFVPTGRLDGHAFWWDVLAGKDGTLDPATRTYALDALSGADEPVRAWAVANDVATREDLPAYARTATPDELAAAVARPGITVGSHSASHAVLSALDARALRDELTRSAAWLAQHLPQRTIPWIAYPYGLESPDVRAGAAAAGYQGAVVISGGWHRPRRTDQFARPRLSVSAGMSLAGFRARLLGSLPT